MNELLILSKSCHVAFLCKNSNNYNSIILYFSGKCGAEFNSKQQPARKKSKTTRKKQQPTPTESKSTQTTFPSSAYVRKRFEEDKRKERERGLAYFNPGLQEIFYNLK